MPRHAQTSTSSRRQPMTGRACLYLRSSKDRNDVSIDAQRRELTELAAARGLAIAEEFVDVVESGKDEDRPGFQALVSAVRRSSRGWSSILMLDTSRLARRRHLAVIFEEMECRRHGVRVVYKSLPESDPITDMLLKSILQAMDEWHSLTSRRKGLAGMAENVRQGWRAGGRAPRGYRLERVATGAVREGAPVTKSRLVPDEHASVMARYLKGRALNRGRAALRAELDLDLADTTLIGIEWQALTYAGHTVWNVHAERQGGAYVGGSKRRPRSEWVIQRDTHEALITDAEAETILARLESGESMRRRRTSADYLLTGVLLQPDGAPWYGDGGGRYYRAGKGRKVGAADIDQAVLGKIVSDFESERFAERLALEARSRSFQRERAEIEQLRAQVGDIDGRMDRFLALAAEMRDSAPVLRKVEQLERDRRQVETRLRQAERDLREAQVVADMGDHQIRRLLHQLATDLETYDRERLKDWLRGRISVTLDPASLACRIAYTLPTRGEKVASPRERDLNPRLKTTSWLKVA